MMFSGVRQSLAQVENNVDTSSNLSLVAPISSFNCARLVALATGAVTVGPALSASHFSDNRFRCESRKACSTLKERLDIISFGAILRLNDVCYL